MSSFSPCPGPGGSWGQWEGSVWRRNRDSVPKAQPAPRLQTQRGRERARGACAQSLSSPQGRWREITKAFSLIPRWFPASFSSQGPGDVRIHINSDLVSSNRERHLNTSSGEGSSWTGAAASGRAWAPSGGTFHLFCQLQLREAQGSKPLPSLLPPAPHCNQAP